MENEPYHWKYDQRFRTLMGQYGITDTHGVELLRAVRIVNNLYDAIFTERLRDDQLSGPRWGLLMRLYMEEAGGNSAGLSPSQLSHHQHVSKNTVSALLRGLEDQGLVERRLDQDDRRSFTIHLTDLGRSQIRENAPEHITFLNQLCAGLRPEERSTLLDLLARLRASLMQHAALGECRPGSGGEVTPITTPPLPAWTGQTA